VTSSARPARTGLIGGTFDPVHLGHLDAAEAARLALSLDEVLLVPARQPPHRQAGPYASIYHRLAMVTLAVERRPGLVASDLELHTPGPSYTSATLARFIEAGRRPWQIFFITGADAFAEIATWRDYPDLLDRAHFVVVSRPGTPAITLRQRLPTLASRMIGPDARFDARLQPPGSPAIFLVDAPTCAVSSTEIRRLVSSGGSIAGLVPDAVADYIRRHDLYSSTTADDLHDQERT
jgi:nicotinate-nucleotide adenylyltransferase